MTNVAPRRVYLVSWWFADFGGQERHVAELACALQRRGVEVHVFSETPVGRNNQYRKRFAESGIPFWCPPLPGWLVQRARQAGVSNPLRTETAARPADRAMGPGILSHWLRRTLDREIRRRRPDLVHVHGFRLGQSWVIPWAVERQIRCIYTEHSTLGDWDGAIRSDAPLYIGTADGIACVSERSAADLGMVLPGKEVEIHPHILPSIRPSDRAPRGIPRLLTVSRLRAEKGLDVLLEATVLLAHRGLAFQLHLAGDGPDRDSLEQQSIQSGLSNHVVFRGALNPEQLYREWREADIFVLPSRTEAMPVSLLEAMSHGLAIVATKVGGVPELIEAGVTGMLVQPESVIELAYALARILEDSGLRGHLGAAAQAEFHHSRYCEGAAVSVVLDSYARALAQL